MCQRNFSQMGFCMIYVKYFCVFLFASGALMASGNGMSQNIQEVISPPIPPPVIPPPFANVPFNDNECFIEEYVGLISELYDKEKYDREASRNIIRALIKPSILLSEVARTLYFSMRQLVPVLVLRPVDDEIFQGFEFRVKKKCNSGSPSNMGGYSYIEGQKYESQPLEDTIKNTLGDVETEDMIQGFEAKKETIKPMSKMGSPMPEEFEEISDKEDYDGFLAAQKSNDLLAAELHHNLKTFGETKDVPVGNSSEDWLTSEDQFTELAEVTQELNDLTNMPIEAGAEATLAEVGDGDAEAGDRNRVESILDELILLGRQYATSESLKFCNILQDEISRKCFLVEYFNFVQKSRGGESIPVSMVSDFVSNSVSNNLLESASLIVCAGRQRIFSELAASEDWAHGDINKFEGAVERKCGKLGAAAGNALPESTEGQSIQESFSGEAPEPTGENQQGEKLGGMEIDDGADRDMLAGELLNPAMNLGGEASSKQVLEKLVMLGLNLKESDSFELCERLRNSPAKACFIKQYVTFVARLWDLESLVEAQMRGLDENDMTESFLKGVSTMICVAREHIVTGLKTPKKPTRDEWIQFEEDAEFDCKK